MNTPSKDIRIDYTFIKFLVKGERLILNIISYNIHNPKHFQLIEGNSIDHLILRNEYASKLEHLFETFKEITPMIDQREVSGKRYRKYSIPSHIGVYGDYKRCSIIEIYGKMYEKLTSNSP